MELGSNSPLLVKCDCKLLTLRDFNETEENIKLINVLPTFKECDKETLSYLDQKYDIPIIQALINPSYLALKRMIDEECKYIPDTLQPFYDADHAAEYGHLNVLKWLVNQKLPITLTLWATRNAARNGHVEVIELLRSQSRCPWDRWTCAYASEHGQLEVLQYLRSQNPKCKWDEYTCTYAAKNGYVKVLIWLRSQTPPCPWNEYTCLYAAKYGQLETLKWMRSQNPPCPWNIQMCVDTFEAEQLNVLKWLEANSCPCSGSLHKHLDIFDDNGF